MHDHVNLSSIATVQPYKPSTQRILRWYWCRTKPNERNKQIKSVETEYNEQKRRGMEGKD